MPSAEVRNRIRWRFIPGWPGYRVSTVGTVQSCRERGPGEYLTDDWRTLATTMTRDGYLQVHLCLPNKTRHRRVHTLVLRAFVGPPPPGAQGCHNDGDKSNNQLGNLRWDTAKGNIDDRKRHGNTARGEKNGNAKIDANKVGAIRALRRSGRTLQSIADEFGISKRQVGRIVKEESWAA